MKKNVDGGLNFVASLDLEELLKQAQFAKTQLTQILGISADGTLPIKISIDTKEAEQQLRNFRELYGKKMVVPFEIAVDESKISSIRKDLKSFNTKANLKIDPKISKSDINQKIRDFELSKKQIRMELILDTKNAIKQLAELEKNISKKRVMPIELLLDMKTIDKLDTYLKKSKTKEETKEKPRLTSRDMVVYSHGNIGNVTDTYGFPSGLSASKQPELPGIHNWIATQKELNNSLKSYQNDINRAITTKKDSIEKTGFGGKTEIEKYVPFYNEIKDYKEKISSTGYAGNQYKNFVDAEYTDISGNENPQNKFNDFAKNFSLNDVFNSLKNNIRNFFNRAKEGFSKAFSNGGKDFQAMDLFLLSRAMSSISGLINNNLQLNNMSSAFDDFAMSFRKTEIVAGMNKEQFGTFQEELLTLAPRVMVMPGELAEAGYQFAARGYMQPENAMKVLKPLSIAGLITGESVSKMSSNVLSLMQAWNPMSLDEITQKAPSMVSEYTDLMTYAFSNSPMNVRWFKDIANYAAPTFANLGFNPTETMATFMAMSQMIPTPGIAARSSRMAVFNLFDTDRTQKVLEKFGLNIQAIIDDVRQQGGGLADVFGQLAKEIEKVPEQQRISLLRGLGGGVRGAMALQALMPVAGNISSYITQIQAESQGMTQKALIDFMTSGIGQKQSAEAEKEAILYRGGEKLAAVDAALQNIENAFLRIMTSLPSETLAGIKGAGAGLDFGTGVIGTVANVAMIASFSPLMAFVSAMGMGLTAVVGAIIGTNADIKAKKLNENAIAIKEVFFEKDVNQQLESFGYKISTPLSVSESEKLSLLAIPFAGATSFPNTILTGSPMQRGFMIDGKEVSKEIYEEMFNSITTNLEGTIPREIFQKTKFMTTAEKEQYMQEEGNRLMEVQEKLKSLDFRNVSGSLDMLKYDMGVYSEYDLTTADKETRERLIKFGTPEEEFDKNAGIFFQTAAMDLKNLGFSKTSISALALKEVAEEGVGTMEAYLRELFKINEEGNFAANLSTNAKNKLLTSLQKSILNLVNVAGDQIENWDIGLDIPSLPKFNYDYERMFERMLSGKEPVLPIPEVDGWGGYDIKYKKGEMQDSLQLRYLQELSYNAAIQTQQGFMQIGSRSFD